MFNKEYIIIPDNFSKVKRDILAFFSIDFGSLLRRIVDSNGSRTSLKTPQRTVFVSEKIEAVPVESNNP